MVEETIRHKWVNVKKPSCPREPDVKESKQAIHYENTAIQIYRQFHLQNLIFFR